MKHLPFQSSYRPEFEVVEHREGKLRTYPHPEQLPLLLRALNCEFYGKLPARLARVDERADGFHKISLKTAALMFCGAVNGSRPDELRLHALVDPDLVARVTIVQQITEEHRRGLCHRFRFYGGEDFFPEIHLCGKRVVFADHVLQRFSSRVPQKVGGDLTNFLLCFYGSAHIGMRVGPGRALVVPYHESLLAFTYKETEAEFFITTCLTVNEMNSLESRLPPEPFNLHYGAAFTKPRYRNWLVTPWTSQLYQSWQRKVPVPPAKAMSARAKKDWSGMAYWVRDFTAKQGHGPGSRICFLDRIPGPCVLELRPGKVEPQFDEQEFYQGPVTPRAWDAFVDKAVAEAKAREQGTTGQQAS